jgi:DNA-binding transcriptional regulator GbsR (MarR family)
MPPLISRSQVGTPPMEQSREGPSAGLLVAQRQISELFISAADVIGMPRSIGEIYGVIFCAPRPVTFQQIVEQLKLSKGSVSQGLKALRSVGAVRKTYVAGDRRDYFEPETELRNLVTGLLRDRIHPHLELGKSRLERVQREVLAGEGMLDDEREVLRARVAKLESWREQGALLLPLLENVLG